jgi:S-adenosylmethionine:tRNA ribosyltransferase-isomerase
MRVDEFDFDLPASAIAQRPAVPRDSARLLRVRGQGLEDCRVSDLPGLLRAGDLLVCNDTKVVPVRLFGARAGTPAPVRIEATLLAQEPGAPAGASRWRAFARPGKRLRPGQQIDFGAGLTALLLEKRDDGEVSLEFALPPGEVLLALEAQGTMPLPPYIRGGVGDARDRADYQTLFAAQSGAVAAPTAGLHFTQQLIERLAAAGIGQATLTLHVGAGTFLPVKAADTADHVMHAEEGELTPEVAARINSTRLLESAADADGTLRPFRGATSIFITPGYRFRAVDLLLTNFHLPRSTLFMLVSAFAGLDRMRAAYARAIATGYRFYSYGDCCLLDRTEESP